MAVTQIGAPVEFTAGTVIVSTDVDSNFAAIRAAFNALVTSTDTLAPLNLSGEFTATTSAAVGAGTIGKEAVTGLAIVGVTGATYDLTLYYASGGGFLIANPTGTDDLIIGESASSRLRFYGGTPTARQTGVAVTAQAIHDALVALGLIGA